MPTLPGEIPNLLDHPESARPPGSEGLHRDPFGKRLEDERVFALDQFGEFFVGVADRLDREFSEAEDGCRPPVWSLVKVPDDYEIDVASLMEVASGKRSVKDDGGDVPARTDLPGEMTHLLDHPESAWPHGAADRVRVLYAFAGILRINGILTASGFLRCYPDSVP